MSRIDSPMHNPAIPLVLLLTAAGLTACGATQAGPDALNVWDPVRMAVLFPVQLVQELVQYPAGRAVVVLAILGLIIGPAVRRRRRRTG